MQQSWSSSQHLFGSVRVFVAVFIMSSLSGCHSYNYPHVLHLTVPAPPHSLLLLVYLKPTSPDCASWKHSAYPLCSALLFGPWHVGFFTCLDYCPDWVSHFGFVCLLGLNPGANLFNDSLNFPICPLNYPNTTSLSYNIAEKSFQKLLHNVRGVTRRKSVHGNMAFNVGSKHFI